MDPREFVIEAVIPLIGMLLSFAAVILIVVLVTRARQRRLEIAAELQTKLIEKFGSTTELVTFLQSPAGREFVSGVQRGNARLTRDRVVSGYRAAIVLSFLGAAFIAMWMITGITGLSWPGVLLLALGLGYFFATLLTARMSADMYQLGVPPASPVQTTRPEM